jgi:hypothetical protein
VLETNRHGIRITKDEEERFCKVIDKRGRLSDDRRRRTRLWAEIRKLAEMTGNWKNASGGKPSIQNLVRPRCSF